MTMLIQTFVVSSAVKGLLISYLAIIFNFIKDITLLKKIGLKVFFSFFAFICFFCFYQSLVQGFNIIYPPDLRNLTLISSESQEIFLFRSSLFSQSLYFFLCIIFYLYIYNYLKKDVISGKNNLPSLNLDKVLKITKIGVIVFILYGFYEFVGYLIYGVDMDFLSNRLTANNIKFGGASGIMIAGLYFNRMASLAGEPSMFAFSILPFMILFYYLKDKTYILCLIGLICSITSTGIVGLFLFLLIDALFFRRTIKFSIIASLFIGIIVYVNLDLITSLYNLQVLKFTLADDSGSERFRNFLNSFMLFLHSDPFHFLFGYGFGLIRSNDGISTLLVNIGLIGTFLYNLFFIYPIFKLKYLSNYRIGLSVAMIVLILTMLISVPEFYIFHIWLLAALLWYEAFKDKTGIKIEESQ